MNILLINHYAGSPILGMEYRPYYMAKEWIKLGHNVTIIAASQAHVRSKQPFITQDFQEENIDSIKYIFIKTPEYEGNGIGRVKNMFSFVSKLYFNAKKISRKVNPDVVIASSTYPLDIFPALRIAKKSQAKLIFEVHDLWPLSPIELGRMSKFHPFIMLLQYAENYAYKHSNTVVSMLPKTQEHMKLHGLDLTKWNYIPNGIDTETWNIHAELQADLLSSIESWRNKGFFLVAYTGSIGIANALDVLIEAAKILYDKNVKIIVLGNGPEKDKLIKLKNELQLDNIVFFDPIPKMQIPYFLSLMDVLYIGLQKENLFRFGISPNKLMDYMMASKPIIQSIEAGNDMVSEANCGLSIEAENPNATADAILELIKMGEEKRKVLGTNGKNFILKEHTYSQLAAKFLKCIDYQN